MTRKMTHKKAKTRELRPWNIRAGMHIVVPFSDGQEECVVVDIERYKLLFSKGHGWRIFFLSAGGDTTSWLTFRDYRITVIG